MSSMQNFDYSCQKRSNNEKKKISKELQSKVLSQLREMFSSTIESDIIVNVAQNCDYRLESSVEALIDLSSGIDMINKKENESTDIVEKDSLFGLKVQSSSKDWGNSSDNYPDVAMKQESSNYKIHNLSPKPNYYLNTCTSPIVQLHESYQTRLNKIENYIRVGYKIVVLMRGVPGSGKSYLAKGLISKYVGNNELKHIFSSDDFFVHINDGTYKFESSRLQEAHLYNQNRILQAMEDGLSPLIVDNTNTRCWEMQPYVFMAVQHGYIIETLEPNTPWSQNLSQLEKKNTHNVPKAKIRAMLERYESNITGEKLLKIFSCSYSPNNKPPQMRCIPPINNKVSLGSNKNLSKLAMDNTSLASKLEILNDKPVDESINYNEMKSIQCAERVDIKGIYKRRKKIENIESIQKKSNLQITLFKPNPIKAAIFNHLKKLKKMFINDGKITYVIEGNINGNLNFVDQFFQNNIFCLDKNIETMVLNEPTDLENPKKAHDSFNFLKTSLTDEVNSLPQKIGDEVCSYIHEYSISNMNIYKNETTKDKKDNAKYEMDTCSSTVLEKLDQDEINHITDNLKSITWKFPVMPTENSDYSKLVSNKKVDQQTMTSSCDLNMAITKGVAEPKYNILDCMNGTFKTENQNTCSIDNNLITKYKLDNVRLANKSVCDYKEVQDRTDELKKLFPYVPDGYLASLYKNLCQHDFDYTVDHLNELTENYNFETLDSKEIEPLEEDDYQIQILKPPEVKPEGSISRNKKSKSKISKYNLELKQELEKKIVLSEDSYHPHILRVKKWKNREPDLSAEEVHSQSLKEEHVENEISNLHYSENNLKNVDFQEFQIDVNNYQNYQQENERFENCAESEEELLQFNLGFNLIKALEAQFGGHPDFKMPNGIQPIVLMRKSMAEELHALWIESLQQQLSDNERELCDTNHQDEEFARALDQKELESISEQQVPNLKDILEMEMALAAYSSGCKRKLRQSTKDMELSLAQKTLHEMFPEYDPEFINQIYEAHNRNFDESVEVVESNCGFKPALTMADIVSSAIKKQKQLLDEIKENSVLPSKEEKGTYLKENQGPLNYEDALKVANDARLEAQRHLVLKNENYQKAFQAVLGKKPAVAGYYADVAKLHINKIDQANSEAANAFVAAQTYVFDETHMLDLHNLYVNEAVEALDIFLDTQIKKLSSSNKSTLQFHIITGRGARSKNSKSKIKPAVIKILGSRNIKYEESNPGCLKVFLKKQLIKM